MKDAERELGAGQNPAKSGPPGAGATPPPLAPLFRGFDWLTMAITFAVVWTVYFLTLAPELTLEDSGELVTGSFYAGIPHPPGYPVWTIFSWLWTVLVPVGNMAWRVALAEGTLGALACGMLSLMVSRGSSMFIESIEELKGITGKWENAICMVSGIVAGLLMGLDGFMWRESVAVNRIAVSSVPWFLVVLLCLMRWLYAPHQYRFIYWALFVFGICFTTHQSLISAALGVEIAIAAGNPRIGRDVFFANFLVFLTDYIVVFFTGDHLFHNIGAKPGLLLLFNLIGCGSLIASGVLAVKTKAFLTEWKPVLIMGCLWVLGVCFYFYMPLAGMTNPPMQWGYPRTREGFFHALTRGQYEQPSPTDILAEPGRFWNQLVMLASGAADEYTWVYLFIALVPFVFFFRMAKRERAWMIGLTAIYCCLGVLLTILLNPSPERATAELVKVFFCNSHTVVAAFIGYGLALTAAFMASQYQRFRIWGLIGGAIAVGLGVYSLQDETARHFFGPAGKLALGDLGTWIKQAFAPNQFGLPVIGGLILVVVPVAFVLALVVYRRRGPLLITLGLYLAMPLYSGLSHWFGCNQHNHWFGYWFGHDMFTPPFNGPDGKPIYPEMTKDAVLYGGTDPGRFCPTYMIFCESFTPHNCQPVQDQKFDRRDVYIITQNALADGTYLNYIRAHYNRSKQIDPPFFQELLRRDKEREQNYSTNLLSRLSAPLDELFTGLGDRVEKRRRTFTSWFTEADFTDLPSLAAKLAPGANQDPLSKFIADNVSAQTRQLLSGHADEKQLKRNLARDLNALIDRELQNQKVLAEKQQQKHAVDQEIAEGSTSDRARRRQEQLGNEIAELAKVGRLYTPERFKHVALSEYLADFIKEDPQSHSRVRLNRLLLEAAYPKELAHSLGGIYPDREMYIATPEDSQRCFSEYLADANKRLQHDTQFPNEPKQIRPGEDVRMVENRVTVSGQVAVMAINGLLTKVMFDHNPKNEFFVEESFPLDWMYPHLTPYGIIMKINRQPLPTLTEDVLKKDHLFWKQFSKRLCGDFIDYDTPIQDIAKWIEKTYLRRDFTGFTGDRKFIHDEDAQKAFSKLRSSIGGIYAWRLGPDCPPDYRPKNQAEYERIMKEADFTFKQAFAICPYSPEAVFRYVQLLWNQHRIDDALVIAETCKKLDPYNGSIQGLIGNLNAMKSQQASMSLPRLEQEVQRNPANLDAAVELAHVYREMQQNDRVLPLLDRVINHPQLGYNAAVRAAQIYAEMANWPKLEATLERLVKIVPENPEAWYDLSAIKATLHPPTEALPIFKQAIALSNQRRKKDPSAQDLVERARGDGRFAPLRQNPEFQQLVPLK